MINVTVDGKILKAEHGERLLDVFRTNGIHLPTLCHYPGILPRGACRLCLVEVQGISRPVPSCCTVAEEGMVVATATDRLHELRKMTLELLLAERNHICSVCVASGYCELQREAEAAGIDHVEFEYRAPKLPVDISHPEFGMDHNRCILCGRCRRICLQIEGACTIDVSGRGPDARIIFDLNRLWGESRSCTSCGKCVEACPTGAMFPKGATVASKPNSFEKLASTYRFGEKSG